MLVLYVNISRVETDVLAVKQLDLRNSTVKGGGRRGTFEFRPQKRWDRKINSIRDDMSIVYEGGTICRRKYALDSRVSYHKRMGSRYTHSKKVLSARFIITDKLNYKLSQPFGLLTLNPYLSPDPNYPYQPI
jgi:hypothetical protein